MNNRAKPYDVRTINQIARNLRKNSREYHRRWVASEHNDRSQLERYGECVGQARKLEKMARDIVRDELAAERRRKVHQRGWEDSRSHRGLP